MKIRLFSMLLLLFVILFVKNSFSIGSPPEWITKPNELNVTLSCSDATGLKAAQAMKPVAKNNCDASQLTLIKTTGAFVPTVCDQSGTYTNTWIATDNCGNTSTVFTQVITIVNNSIPVISPLPALSVLKCFEIPNFTYPTVTVGCDLHIALAYVDVTSPGSCPSSYKITRTWTAKDGCGNISEPVSQTISFEDTQGPEITTPAGSLDRKLECSDIDGLNEALALHPDAADDCSATVEMHLISDLTVPVPGKLSNYNRIRKWNFTDTCGNVSAEFTQNIQVSDTQNPVITAPAAILVNSDPDKCGATGVNLGTPVTADNCFVASVTNDAVEPFHLGSNTVTWTVTDGAGNTSTATQLVTVTDTVKPKIMPPPALKVSTNANSCNATGVNLGSPATSDNCSVVSVTNDAVEPFAIGNTIITWTVKDEAGNSATAAQTITVFDSIKPVIFPPPPVTVNSDPDKCEATGVNLGSPVVSDNCSAVTITNNAAEPYPTGQTSVIWRVVDSFGNTSTAVQIVTVIDNQPPQIQAPAPVNVNTDPGKKTASGVNLGNPMVSDNCATTVSNNAVQPFSIGTTTVTWTVVDNYGNKSIATQLIKVSDNEKPVFIDCTDKMVNTDPGQNTYLLKINNWNSIVTDNDSVVTLSYHLSGATSGDGSSLKNLPFNIGTTTIALIAADPSGNSTSCTYTITVTDKEPPKLNCPSDQIKEFQTGIGNKTYLINGTSLDITATDNDSIKSVSYFLSGVTGGTGTSLNGVSLNIGETDVIWTAVDFAGNTSNCLIKITVLDSNLPPVVTNYQFTIKKGTELSANLLIPIPGNSNQIKVTSLTLAAFGQLNLSEQGQFTYTPFKDFVGEDHFIYQVCKPESSSLCASAEVTILVIEDNTGQVNVPDSFSPNGDGINDYFKIKGLSGYPDAILKIFTRSGVKVFEQKNYGNTDFWGNEEKAWWDGRTDSKWNIGNSKLAPATYVYTLELERGKVLTGTVYLNY